MTEGLDPDVWGEFVDDLNQQDAERDIRLIQIANEATKITLHTETWGETEDILNQMADDFDLSLEERAEFFVGVVDTLNTETRERVRVRHYLAARYPEYRHLAPDAVTGWKCQIIPDVPDDDDLDDEGLWDEE